MQLGRIGAKASRWFAHDSVYPSHEPEKDRTEKGTGPLPEWAQLGDFEAKGLIYHFVKNPGGTFRVWERSGVPQDERDECFEWAPA
jgi:hypothetical protein